MENFEFFSDSFGKMSGFLTFLILVLVVLSYVTIKFKETINELVKKNKHNRDINDLIYHSMFLTSDKVIQRIEKIDFTTFDGYDEIKSKLLKKLIQLKIDTVKTPVSYTHLTLPTKRIV